MISDLFKADNLAGSFLELPQLTQKVPKPWFGVRSEDSHFVHRGLWLIFNWEFVANDTEFTKWSLRLHFLLRNSNLTSFFLAKQTGKQTAGFKVVGDTVVVVDLAIRYLVSGTNLLRPVNSKWMKLINYIRLFKNEIKIKEILGVMFCLLALLIYHERKGKGM